MPNVRVQLESSQEVECWRPFALCVSIIDAATGQPLAGLRPQVRYQRDGDTRTFARDEAAEEDGGIYSFPMRFSTLAMYAVRVTVPIDARDVSQGFSLRASPMQKSARIGGATYRVQAEWWPGHIHSNDADEVRLRFTIAREQDRELSAIPIDEVRVVVTSDKRGVRDEIRAERVADGTFEARRVFSVEEVGPFDITYQVALAFRDPETGMQLPSESFVFPLPVGPSHGGGDASETDSGSDHGHSHDEVGQGHPHEKAGHSRAGVDLDDHHDHGSAVAEHGHQHRTGLAGLLSGLFVPHSHDAADSLDSALETSTRGIRATKISLAVLMLTAVVQLGLVLVTNSVALLADTVHNFGDALTSVPLWIAFVLGRRAATRRFTYGYRRAEDLAGLAIVVMIGLSVVLVLWESIDRLLRPQGVEYLPILIGAGIIGFLGNEAVAIYRIRIGREIGSAALVADGYHARTDGITSLGVVVGALGVAVGFPQADAAVGLVIAGMILVILVGAARQVFARLMDAVEPEVVAQIESAAAGIDGVIEIDAVRARWSGHRMEASLHAVVDCTVSVAEGHRIAERVRQALVLDVRSLDSVLVHVDPCDHSEVDHHAATQLTV